jgi:hypothetical protein
VGKGIGGTDRQMDGTKKSGMLKYTVVKKRRGSNSALQVVKGEKGL